MNIVGIIAIFVLPYMAGYILRTITNRKETGQIETYLIGFFFVFLLQGLVFLICSKLGYGFQDTCYAYLDMSVGLVVIFAIALCLNIIRHILLSKGLVAHSALLGEGETENTYKRKPSKQEIMLCITTVLVGIAIVARVWTLIPYLRSDIMIETVRTTLATGTINEYNPITSQPYTLGLIPMRKLISLPTYYSYYCEIFGVDEVLLLFFVLTVQTILCTYFACVRVVAPIFHNRRETILFSIFLGGLILSGDYFSGAIGEKLLWYGYAGDAIVAAVALPYVLSVMIGWYREASGIVATRKGYKIVNVLKILLCLCSSVFLTGIATGALLILIATAIASVCLLLRLRGGEHNG